MLNGFPGWLKWMLFLIFLTIILWQEARAWSRRGWLNWGLRSRRP